MVGDSYTIPLYLAHLCVSCDRIGADASKCHWCDNQHGLISLVGILNKTSPEITTATSKQNLHRVCAEIDAMYTANEVLKGQS